MVQRYNVYAVPKVVINETHEFVGALPEPEFVTAIERAARGAEEDRQAEAGGAVEGDATPLGSGPGGEHV